MNNPPYIEIERQISEAPPICAIIRAQMLMDGPEELFEDIWIERFETPDGKEIPELVFAADQVGELLRVAWELYAAIDDAKNALKLASDEEKV
jgi:hypothetical protein